MEDSDILRTRKKYHAVSIRTCVHHGQLGKAKRYPQKNLGHQVSYSRRKEYKMEVPQVNNSPVFDVLLKEVLLGCKAAVSPEPLWRNCTMNYLAYEGSTRQPFNNLGLFHALALSLQGNQRLEEDFSKNFISFIKRMDGLSPNQFKGVHMNDIPRVKDLLTLNIRPYDMDIVDGNIIG